MTTRSKRALTLGILGAAAWAAAGTARADLQSRTYQFKDSTILEMSVETTEGMRLESVQFRLPAAAVGSGTRAAGVAAAELTISNRGSQARRVGLAVALFDDDGRLLAVARGGNGVALLRAGRQKKYVLVFEGVNAEVRRATTFQVSIESKP